MKKYSITIDAGHGGKETGATYNSFIEKDANLITALAVGIELEKRNVDVHFTREIDETLSIQHRVDASETADTDMLVSFHRYGKGNTGVGVIVGDANEARIGEVTKTKSGAIMRLARPEYEMDLAKRIVSQFQKHWSNTSRDREVIIEGRDTKLQTLGLFAQQRIQKPTFIIELGSVKPCDALYTRRNFPEIVDAAATGIYDALVENQIQVEKRQARSK